MSQAHDGLVDAIGVIYEAGLEEDRWGDVLESVVHTVGGQRGMLGLTDAVVGNAEFFHTYGLDPAVLHRWDEEFGQEDPWADRVAGLQEGDVVRGIDLFTFEELLEKRVYREIAEPLGARDVLASIVAKNRLRVGWVNAYDEKRAEGFSDESVYVMARLTPHLQRATRLHAQFVELRTREDASTAALDALDFGVVACDDDGRIVHMNRWAEERIEAGDGLRVQQSRLLTPDLAATERLRELLRRCSATASLAGGEGGGALLLSRHRADARPYTAFVVPLSRRRELSLRFAPTPQAVSLVVVMDPEQDISSPTGVLRELYGFTAAEATMALTLANGGTVDDYADRFRVKRETARWHLKRVLAKTNAGKQGRLVSMLLRALAPLRR